LHFHTNVKNGDDNDRVPTGEIFYLLI